MSRPPNPPERRPGLMVAERKNVSVYRQFAVTTDQSCLNRWLVEASWDRRRSTTASGVATGQPDQPASPPTAIIAIDNTLVERGLNAQPRHCPRLLISNYCPSGSHYPIEWRRFLEKDSCPAEDFKDHTTLCLDLIDDALARDIPGDFTVDSYFTHAKVLNHIHAKQRHYVGALKLNRKVVFDGREQKLQEVASQIPFTDKKAVPVGKRCYWYFSKRMRIATVSHPVRIVLFWKDRHATEASKALVTNRVVWEVLRMLRVYRHRWTGTETFHRDGKQQLGLGDCQVRSGKGQTRHVYPAPRTVF